MQLKLGYNNFAFIVPNIEAGHLLERFWVSAVASIFIIRGFLKFTGYPQIGGGEIHFAHMLFGGFFMMLALFILFMFLNKESKHWAAIFGGIGFGAFIDELGKFITSDNNYFFEPTIALIYVILVAIFLLTRLLEQHFYISQRAYAINALEVAKEVLLYDLDTQERDKALQYLDLSEQDNPAISGIRTMLESIVPKAPKKTGPLTRVRTIFYELYATLIKNRWFAHFLVIFFVVYSTLNFIGAVANLHYTNAFYEWGQIFSSILTWLFVILGINLIAWGHRLGAYEMFNRAILVSIFLTQFFLFYERQFAALIYLLISLIVFLSIQYLIDQEQTMAARQILTEKRRGLRYILDRLFGKPPATA